MSFFISDALAANPLSHGAPNQTFNLILMLVVFAAFMYFFIWRPQSQRVKAHRNMVSSLKPGDEIVTSGGLIGKIVKVEESFIKLSVAQGMDVTVQRSSIGTVLPKGTMKD